MSSIQHSKWSTAFATFMVALFAVVSLATLRPTAQHQPQGLSQLRAIFHQEHTL